MKIIEGLALALTFLSIAGLVGWYVIAPAVFWVCDKYFELTSRAIMARYERDRQQPPFQPTA